MHQGTKLKKLIDNSGKTREDVASSAGISVASLYNYFKEEEINSKKLKVLLDAIGLGLTDFNKSGSSPDQIGGLQERIKTLEQTLKDKEMIIVQQAEIIEMLKAKLNRKK